MQPATTSLVEFDLGTAILQTLAKEMRFIQLLGIIVASFFVGSCDSLTQGDVVQGSYADIEAAKKDGLFERGWLPDILPASTTQIVTRNDLDLNRSSGGFSFVPADFSKFQAQLKECVKSRDESEEILEYAKRGYRPFCHSSDGSTWRFYVNGVTGRCEYRMEQNGKAKEAE